MFTRTLVESQYASPVYVLGRWCRSRNWRFTISWRQSQQWGEQLTVLWVGARWTFAWKGPFWVDGMFPHHPPSPPGKENMGFEARWKTNTATRACGPQSLSSWCGICNWGSVGW